MKLKFRAEPKDVVIFFIFAFFLLYLVAVGVLNLHSLTVESRFWGLNPFPAFGPDYIAATLVFFLLALIGLSMSVSSYFFDREKGFGFVPGAKKAEDGYSKLMSETDMKKSYDIKRVNLADDHLDAAGIPIILKSTEAWVDNGENHSLIIGGTGSGKSQCSMIPMAKILAKAGESMIFTDPKGELYRDISGILKDKGYNIVVLNFRDPLKGNCWNPFSLPYKFYKEGKDDKSKELIEDLANNILIDPESKADPFWNETAASYFSGLAMGLFQDAESEEYVNINSINQMATSGEERFGNGSYLNAYFKDKGETSTAYISASATINAPSETKASIVSSFKTKIRIFSSRESMSEMLSKTDFDFSRIGKEKSAVFLIIQDEKKTYHSLVTIFLKQIYESLVDVASEQPNLKLPVRTNFLLDEFANMPALKDVDAMISASRSRNIRFNFIIQNYAQLNKQYGAEMAETIKGNCGNILFLNTTELKALEEISKLCGEKKGKKNKDKPDEPDKPLLTLSDLQKLKKFEFVIKRLRCDPFKIKFTPDFEIQQANGWGATYETAELPKREPNSPQIFDIKDFVQKRTKEKMMKEIEDGEGTGGNQMTAPIPPFMMGGNRPSSKPQGLPNMDEFLKNIDATIAKLEEEERQEKERLKAKEAEEKKQKEIKEEKEVQDKQEETPKPLVVESQIEPKISVMPEEEQNKEEVVVNSLEDVIKEEIEKVNNEAKPDYEQQFENIKPYISEEKEVEVKEEQVKKEEHQELPKPELKKDKSNREEQGKEIEELMGQINKGKNEINPFNINRPLFEEKEDEEKQEVKKVKEEEKKEVKHEEVKEEEKHEEKTKINVDKDSVIVDDNVTDDEFFDDFFSDDEE